MEAGRVRRYRDDSPRLPTSNLGLSSVRLIVTKFESERTRVNSVASEAYESDETVNYDQKTDKTNNDFPLDRSSGQVWNRLLINFGLALYKGVPSVSFGNFGILAVTTGLCAPRMISYLVLYPFCRLVFGTLYPAYASYKAVRTKNLKEYVKWMMYWIVFALFTCTETFTDVFLSWFPFYYEVKIVLVLWLLSPATKGSSILYRKFVHPALCRREQEIDEYIAKAKDQGYHTVLNLGTKGVNYATTVIMQTAIKGGGGLVQQLRKSYSLSDLTECEPREERGSDEADDVLTEPRLIKRGAKSGYSTRRSASESNSRQPLYFPEVDVDVRGPRPNRMDEPDFSHIKSSEDISSGYSSADNSGSLTRTGSLGASARIRGRTSRTTVTPIKRPQAAEESEVIDEELHDNDSFEYANIPSLVTIKSPLYLSHTDPPFLYQYIGDQVKIVQVLGSYPLQANSNNVNNNTDSRNQKEINTKEPSLSNTFFTTDRNETLHNDTIETEIHKANTTLFSEVQVKNQDQKEIEIHCSELSDSIKDNKKEQKNEIMILAIDSRNNNESIDKGLLTIEKDAKHTTTSIDNSNNLVESAESDDEASFGTPDNSPKYKRKLPKGKYGKSKAPLPPKGENEIIKGNANLIEAVTDIAVTEDNNVLQSSDVNFSEDDLFENHSVEKKVQDRSRSPVKNSKINNYGISKLLQLPVKLAFWHKNEESPKSDDNSSSTSNSRRSSFTDRTVEDFESCLDLNTTSTQTSELFLSIPQIEVTNAETTSKEDNENIQQDIELLDVKSKIVETKFENNSEYSYIPLHDDNEIATTSKTTDV